MAKSIRNRVFGSDIPNIIKKKIESRQLLAKKDRSPNEQIKPSNYPDDRSSYYTYSELNEMNFDGVADLSGRTPFARMWTAVTVAKDVKHGGTKNKDQAAEWQGKKAEANPNDSEYKNKFLKEIGKDEFEVHEWVDVDDSLKVYTLGNHVLGTEQVNPNTPRTTGAGDISTDVMRELLPNEQETDMNTFLKPPAGITSVSSATEGPLGALKKTTVSFIVHNFSDFEKIYLRYFMKPGAQVFIDFGWDTGYLYDPKELLSLGAGGEMEIEKKLYGNTGYVTLSNGDMESLYGHVVNYDAKVREDGGFDCSLDIISKNASILSNSFDQKLKDRVKYGLDIEIMAMAVAGVTGDYSVYKKAKQWGQADSTEDELRYAFTVATIKMLGGTTAPLPGMKDTPNSMAALKQGVFYAGTMEENMKLFVNFGWLEDNFLNKELAFGDDTEELTNKTSDKADSTEGKLLAKFNSRNSFITYNAELHRAMMMRGFYEGAIFLYPDSWGSYGPTYNSKIKMVPDDRYGFDSPYWKWRNGAPPEEVKIPIDRAEAGEYKLPGEPENPIDISDEFSIENWDRNEGRIPLREIFISLDTIKSMMDVSSTTSDFLRNFISKMKDASGGIVNLGVQSNNYGQHTLSFIDKNLLAKGSKAPSDENQLSDFLQDLLVFNPYSPDTIVKEYDLSFSMPQSGLGNMIAIQSADSVGGDQSVNDMLDGLIKLEEMDRKGIVDKFIRYVPSVGKEAGKRLLNVTSKEGAGTFNFKSTDIAYNQNSGIKDDTKNLDTDLGTKLPYSDYLEKLNENLDRAVDEDVDLKGEDTTPEPEEEKEIEDTKKSEEDIAKRKNENLVNTPYDFWIKKAVKSHTSTVIPIIPIQVSLKIYGISGLMPGDLIRVNYLPQKYYLNSYFQITKVSQAVGETWDTSIETQMRIAPMHRPGNDQTVIVRKSYLRNVLKLDKVDAYIHTFGNLLPLDIPNSPDGDRLVFIDNIFQCTAEGTLEDGRDFSLPIMWSNKRADEIENSVGSSFFGSWQGASNKTSTKFKMNTEWLASIVEDTTGLVSDDADFSGIEVEVKNLKKGTIFYIITSGNKWIIWHSIAPSDLTQVNLIFSYTRGKQISKKLEDVSWKAKGQAVAKTAAKVMAPVKEVFLDAVEEVEDFIDTVPGKLKDAGNWIKDKFSGWW
tara:strand:- start:341 stop:3841 length:3501 start_codon:yes stop_codon:yes gene_type:complete